MNIAYILADPGIGVFGSKGASVHVQEMIRALRSHGHDVHVYCLRRGEKNGTQLVPDDLADVPVTTVPLYVGPDGDREKALRAASDALVAAASAGSPDLVYERYSLFSDVGRRLGAPLVLEVNAPLIDEQAEHRHLADAATARALSEQMFAAADLVSCVSAPVADWVRGLCPTARTVVTPNGVNTERIRPAAGPRAGRHLTLGFLGTLKPWHGTSVLLDALARTRHPWHLEFCGTGPQLPDLREQAAALGLSRRVRFHGAVAPAEVPAILASWDAACAPYPQAAGHYFSPLKVYEYMAAGLPVVASAVGELPGLLEDRGLLVTPGSAPALAVALDQLAADPGRRERLGTAARAHVVRHHTWDRRCGELLAALPTPVGR